MKTSKEETLNKIYEMIRKIDSLSMDEVIQPLNFSNLRDLLYLLLSLHGEAVISGEHKDD